MTNLVKLARYQQWANKKTAHQLQSLPADVADKELGGSFPTIRLTLLHQGHQHAEQERVQCHERSRITKGGRKGVLGGIAHHTVDVPVNAG